MPVSALHLEPAAASPTPGAQVPLALLPLWAHIQSRPAHQVDEGLNDLLVGLHGLFEASAVDWHLHARSPACDVPCVARRTWPPMPDRDERTPPEALVLRHTEPLWHGGEMSFCVRRACGAPAFTPGDAQLLALLLSGLTRWLNWLALSHGPMQPHKTLPEHQRKVLLQLATGKSEKQIAAALGLSHNTTHQYIMMIYRRFGVRNRASLIDHWLGGRPQMKGCQQKVAASFMISPTNPI